MNLTSAAYLRVSRNIRVDLTRETLSSYRLFIFSSLITLFMYDSSEIASLELGLSHLRSHLAYACFDMIEAFFISL